MESLTIRVSRSTHGLLRELAEQTGDTMAEIVDRSVREYQRRRFWADYHAAYAAIQADPQARADLQGEVEGWDSTSADGLEDRANGPGTADDSVEG
jgi:predicted transcriptional regulator